MRARRCRATSCLAAARRAQLAPKPLPIFGRPWLNTSRPKPKKSVVMHPSARSRTKSWWSERLCRSCRASAKRMRCECWRSAGFVCCAKVSTPRCPTGSSCCRSRGPIRSMPTPWATFPGCRAHARTVPRDALSAGLMPVHVGKEPIGGPRSPPSGSDVR